MKKIEFAGIDVSKATLDARLFSSCQSMQFKNNSIGIKQMLEWTYKCIDKKFDDVTFCFEHTGIYSSILSNTLSKHNITYYQVSGLMVKKSLGLARGKNDKVDAARLGEYVYRHHDKLNPFQIPSPTVMKIKDLLSFRNKLVRDRIGYKAHLTEIEAMKQIDNMREIVESSKLMIATINKEIKRIETLIKSLIKSQPELEKTFNNITSIKGVGLILGTTMIAWTNNFSSFSSWRKFACYIGTAPFEHSSGTSYRGKTRVSVYGNRKLKSIIFLCASSAIQHNVEMREYYKRKIEQGKSKMTALNGVSNKIISRIFAIAKRQTPWVDVYKFAA